MKTFEFNVGETLSDRDIAALRWELFVFHEIKDIVRAPREGLLAIVYEGEPRPDGGSRTHSVNVSLIGPPLHVSGEATTSPAATDDG